MAAALKLGAFPSDIDSLSPRSRPQVFHVFLRSAVLPSFARWIWAQIAFSRDLTFLS